MGVVPLARAGSRLEQRGLLPVPQASLWKSRKGKEREEGVPRWDKFYVPEESSAFPGLCNHHVGWKGNWRSFP